MKHDNIPNGIYKDLSIKDYHLNKTHISASTFKYVRQSPKHFKWYLDHPEDLAPSGSFLSFGNSFELALIDPKAFDKEVAIAQTEAWIAQALEEKPDLKVPKASANYKNNEKAFLETVGDKYVINDVGTESFETIEHMLTSCKQDATIQTLLKNTDYQTSVFWKDEETGLNLKTRPDVCKINKNVVIDVKTTIDGSPEGFARAIGNLGYHFQACMQIDGVISSGLMPSVDKYYWLVVEKVPPYSATVYHFSDEDRAWAYDEYSYIKTVLKRAIAEGKYPSYSQRADNEYGILTANIPLWVKNASM